MTPVGLTKVACVVFHAPRVKTHRKRVLVLHGQGELGVVVVLKGEGVALLVEGEQPAHRASILSPLTSSLFENFVTKEEVLRIDLVLRTESFQSQLEFLLEFTHHPPIENTIATFLSPTIKRMDTVSASLADFSFGVIRTSGSYFPLHIEHS